MSHSPYHHAQMLRTLPDWSKALHPDHASLILQSLRMEYLDAAGVAYPWYSQADTLSKAALQRAIAKRDKSRRALQAALGALQGIPAFCTPLLEEQLQLDTSASQAQYVYQPTGIELPTGIPGGPNVPTDPGNVVAKGEPQFRSLLEAALHNFEGAGDTTRLSRLQRSRQDIQPVDGLSVASFINQCRSLDLGKHYQAHLDEVFEGTDRARLQALAITARRDEFRVQARIASCKGQLSAAGLAALDTLYAEKGEPVYEDRPMHCWQILLFGVPIHEMLFIAPEQNRTHDPVFLYNPVDEQPIREFASLGDARKHLREQLLQADFRTRFVALALQRQQQQFKQQLLRALYSNADQTEDPLLPRDSAHLQAEIKALPSRPWGALEGQHLVRLRADARFIAVPTADVDARVRQRNLEYWLELGMTVLNVSAMFVPCLNPLMLTLGAAQIMGSVFEGISAWEQGDNAQALAQLESVLLNAAVVAGVGAGAVALKASGFVDGMQSIIKDGKDYLWNGSLDPYASTQSLPEHLEADALGRYTLEERHYVRIDNQLYEQVQAQGRSQIAHPEDRQAYRPTLLDNGEGAWRAAHERPVEWDQQQLLRRLGPISAGLENNELEAAMQCSGLQEDALRHAQVASQRPPALLADMLDRLRSARQVDDLVDRVRHDKPLAAYRNFALPSLPELDGWPEYHVIKAYHGPESWGSSTRYGAVDEAHPVEIEINRGELENGQLSSRIVAQLDEQALNALLPTSTTAAERTKALSEALAQHLEHNRQALFDRLYSRHQPALSPTAQVLANQFPGLPPRALEQILARIDAGERSRLASARVPLRVAEEARALQAQSRLNKALLGLYRADLSNADSAALDATFKTEHPDADAHQRFELAVADRARSASLLGQQPIRPGYRSPMRLANGRIGYPLSGRLPWFNTADRRLRALYPSLNNSQRNALLGQLRQRGDAATQIRALEIERDTLDTTLREWQSQGAESERGGRSEVRHLLNAAWRRDDPDTLLLEALEIDNLPSLPARFDHITSVNIRNIGIRQIPADFFQSFPALRTLHLVQNPHLDFEGLFQALESTPQLEVLELGNNQMGPLTDTMRQRLARLTSLRRLSLRLNRLQLADADLQAFAQLPLESLDFEYNDITLDAARASRFNRLTALVDLRLTNNPLHHAPDVTGLVHLQNLQLRNCVLQQWPTGLTQLMLQADPPLRHLSLSYNPISRLADLEQIVASPFAETLRTGRRNAFWDFNENSLDDASNLRLRAIGVEIATDSEASDATDDLWLDHASDAQRQRWDELFEGNANRDLREVLIRATGSQQAQSNPQGMAQQVWQLLDQVAQDEALRTHLNDIAQDYPPTCGDAGADGFSALEIEAQVFRELNEESERPAYLFNFFRSLYRREMVNALAERIQLARLARQARLLERQRLGDVTQPEAPVLPTLDRLDVLSDAALQRGGVDLIEIRLALRQSLAQSLEFPENSQGMLYRAEAMVSEQVAHNVEQAVTLLDQTATERRAWVARQPSWRRYLQQRFASRFTNLDERWYQGLQYLDYCLDPENEAVTSLDPAVLAAISEQLPDSPQDANGQLRRVELNSQLYDQASRQLNAGRELQREALFTSLTAEQDRNA